MATLKDVAKKANVSAATVSCCLSGARNVKPETRLRIMQAVEELGYIPNSAARELRKTTSNKIGLLLPDLVDPYYNGILRGVLERLHPGDYILSIAFSDQSPREECKKIRELLNANVAGLLIVTCQPENTGFFQSTLLKRGIPSVFIHQKPPMEANYIGFDNYRVMKQLTASLLARNYRDIALIMGPKSFSSEEECLRGVRDGFYDRGLEFPQENLYLSNMTKEDAFRTAMLACRERVPEAILSTSSQMTLGIKEALDLSGIRVPQDTVLATLGVESWNATSRLEGVLYSRRSADSLGTGAAQLLLDQIESELPPKPMSIAYLDNEDFSHPDIPLCFRQGSACPEAHGSELRILTHDSPSVSALEMLSHCYGKQHGIRFHFHRVELGRLIPLIITNSKKPVSDFDAVIFDTPWTPYLGFLDVLEDLTPVLESGALGRPDFFRSFLENARYGDRQIGLPIICGTQVMFYRKDLFQKPSVMRAYKAACDRSLRPPRTWNEYNQVARFFTRSQNPQSPTAWGTALPCNVDEYLIPELMLRLWSRGAKLWDSSYRPTLNTGPVLQAYEAMLNVFPFVPGDPLQTDATQVISRFAAGELAMIIAFTDYAGQIRDSLDRTIISNIGYAPVPGKISLQAGRNLGIFRNCTEKQQLYDYFRWLFEPAASSYYTILGGQTCIRQPYENSEIIGQYPWMALSRQPADHCYSRSVPLRRGQTHMIPINRFETVLSDALRRTAGEGMALRSSLEMAEVEMQALFSEYGF